MNRVVLIIFVLAVGAYVTNKHIEKTAALEAEKAEDQYQQDIVHSLVSTIVTDAGATKDWHHQLIHEESYIDPVITIELERLWLQGQPILFIGEINDIVSLDTSNYKVTIIGSDYNFYEDLELSLKSSKEMIDLLLKSNPSLLSERGSTNTVAVIAAITSIQTRRGVGTDWGDIYINYTRIGIGDLIDILRIGRVNILINDE